jgi:NTE family protein
VTHKRFGLALGSGGARGSAHVGVLKVLEENGLAPDIIAGTSMGAEVGGAYAAGASIEDIAAVWREMSTARFMRAILPTVPWSGWSSGREVPRTMHRLVGDPRIEDLATPFAAVATDLSTGLPYTITRGPLALAVRASVSIPGLFTPVWIDGHLLIDGGVSDPLPVDVARRLGADVVAAVDVLVDPQEVKLSGIPAFDYKERILGITKGLEAADELGGERRFHPSVFTVLFQMSTVFQKRVSDLLLQIHAPDVLIRPDFAPDPPSYGDVKQGIEAGEEAARRALPQIRALLSAE